MNHIAPTAIGTLPGGAASLAEVALTPPLRVRTLGVFAVWRGQEPVPSATFAQRKAAQLFKVLLAAPGHRLPREQVADLLWPDADPAHAAQRLRSTLHRLRGALGAAYLPGAGDLVLLDPAPGAPSPPPDWLDTAAFERAAAAALAAEDPAAARAALGLYGGAYLPEESDEGEVGTYRRALRGLARALTMHAARLAPPAEASRLFAGLLREEPTHEEAALALMGVLAGQGRTAEALRAYDALARALVEDVGLDPGPPLQALRARLLAPLSKLSAPPAFVPAEVPPPAHLPAPLSSFFGRRRELLALQDALSRARLLTLTGPGGVGKTRLALELARAVHRRYPDGVYVCDLAPRSDPALVPAAVAALFQVREEKERDVLATLIDVLRPRHLLLVLDNAEHLVDACAAVVGSLLSACPHLRIVTTSRTALDITGETLYLVPIAGRAPGRRASDRRRLRGGPTRRGPRAGDRPLLCSRSRQRPARRPTLPSPRWHPARAGAGGGAAGCADSPATPRASGRSIPCAHHG